MKFTQSQLVFIKSQFADFDENDFIAKAEAYVTPKRSLAIVSDDQRCEAIKKDGVRCSKKVSDGNCKCSLHLKYEKKEKVVDNSEKVKCVSLTGKGTCCRRYAVADGMCAMHAKSALPENLSADFVSDSEPEYIDQEFIKQEIPAN